MGQVIDLPAENVPAGQQFELSTAGRNSAQKPVLVHGLTGVALDDTNATAFLTLVDASDATVLAQTAMSWVAAAPNAPRGPLPTRWAYVPAASVCVPGHGPWTQLVDIYGPGGTGDTHFGTMRKQLNEEA